MKIQFENVDFSSRSGPNGFGLKLARSLHEKGHQIVQTGYDVNLAFIQTSMRFPKTVLRLDGIYFNTRSDWKKDNYLIEKSYQFSDAIVAQSNFDKNLIQKYFGKREEIYVIPNGTDLQQIEKIPPANLNIDKDKVWMCASSWRPHKRLKDNVEYFCKFADQDEILIVAGKNPDYSSDDPRVKYIGDLSWENMISCMKSSKRFIHLAWLDHCPNVVVDAVACDCEVICSNSGGTPEIMNSKGIAIKEKFEWDFEPIDLYDPPSLDFENVVNFNNSNYDPNILKISEKYLSVLEGVSQ